MTLAPSLPQTSLPEGPTALPFIQLINWLSRPYPFLDDCYRRYGDLFTVRLSNFCPLVFCSHPDGIQAIFKAPPERFEVGRTNNLLLPLVGEESILLLDGDRHQRQRQLLMPPFHGERMRTYGRLMCEITEQVMTAYSNGQPFAVRPVMQSISLQVILQTVFGIGEGNRYEELQQAVSNVLDMTGSPLSSSLLFIRSLQQDWGAWSPWGKFLRERAKVDAILYSEIRQRRADPEPDRQDICTLLLSATDEDGQPMSEVELRDELVTLLVAGHETTASALSWALYWIHHQPEVYNQLMAELQNAELSDLGAIARLPYLNAVCQETLRFYPIVPIAMPRLVIDEPFQLMGHSISPGNMVVPCIYLAHRHPESFPQPEQFRPERFLERQFSPYEYLPFGGSNRVCIGMAFALYEMKLALATVMTRYRFELVGDRPPAPVRRGVTLAPPTSLTLKATPRVG